MGGLLTTIGKYPDNGIRYIEIARVGSSRENESLPLTTF